MCGKNSRSTRKEKSFGWSAFISKLMVVKNVSDIKKAQKECTTNFTKWKLHIHEIIIDLMKIMLVLFISSDGKRWTIIIKTFSTLCIGSSSFKQKTSKWWWWQRIEKRNIFRRRDNDSEWVCLCVSTHSILCVSRLRLAHIIKRSCTYNIDYSGNIPWVFKQFQEWKKKN